jgi:hypothetical protein
MPNPFSINIHQPLLARVSRTTPAAAKGPMDIPCARIFLHAWKPS